MHDFPTPVERGLEVLEQTKTASPSPPPPPAHRFVLHDHHRQLMLLEHQNKERMSLLLEEEQRRTGQAEEQSLTPHQLDLPSTIASSDLYRQPFRPSAEQMLAPTSHLDATQFQQQTLEPPAIAARGIDSHEKRLSSATYPRKPVPLSKIDPVDGAFVQDSPSYSVHVEPPWNRHQPEPSSVPVEDHASQRSSMWSPHSLRRQSMDDRPASPSSQQSSLPDAPPSPGSPATARVSDHALVAHSRDNSLADLSGHLSVPGLPRPHNAAAEVGSRPLPQDRQDSSHSHTIEERLAMPAGRRASRITFQSTRSDESANSDPKFRNEYLAPAGMRNSTGALPRPDSLQSSVSDFGRGRGRDGSPRGSSNGYARASSAHSAAPSPDQRPLSYVDLLNVPYPQAPPVSADQLGNTHLRAAVGSNASLLSTRKTLEMYRSNVKKTNDPAIQYEFAIFMVSAAQEVPPEPEKKPTSDSSPPSRATHSDLLKEARQILQRLSDRSYPFAQYYLADGYASGLFNKGKEDYDKAFPLFLSASKHGHAEAGYRTALCYEFGWGCRIDGAKAIQFYRHAASKNHPGAMLRLGKACLVGDMGLVKRYREGVKWLKRAAESADFQYNSAPYELGLLHETGYGDDIFRDEVYAAQLFTKSADLGHAEANYRLGMAYEHGTRSCPHDAGLSVHFYTGAAQQSHPLAMMALCAWYMVGAEPVLEKDENEAFEWARRAAETGLARAEYTVGFFTEIGIGCRRDLLEANVWYVRAADQGDQKAIHRIAAIRATASGADPVTAALPKPDAEKSQPNKSQAGSDRDERKTRSKKFGIF